MKNIFLLFLIFPSVYSQNINQLHTPQNIRLFADHLFDEQDYLRAVFEYEKLIPDDTLQFKIALSYQLMNNYQQALEEFSEFNTKSLLYKDAQREYYKTILLSEDYDYLQSKLKNDDEIFLQRVLYLSYLFTTNELPDKNMFLEKFPSDEKDNLNFFYNYKYDPPYKSSLLAGLMSAIIPGSGKIYLGEIGDGITALLANSLLAFLSYDNFKHNHDFRGWLFAGLGFFFYSGNIYGSVAAAQIYNARIDYEYDSKLKDYLDSKNYFIPENEFVK